MANDHNGLLLYHSVRPGPASPLRRSARGQWCGGITSSALSPTRSATGRPRRSPRGTSSTASTRPSRPWRNNRGQWFELAGNEILSAHVSELKAGGCSARHRHTTEAYLYIVKGAGFTLINYDDDPVTRIDWAEGMLLSPPRWAWHQHFNLSPDDTARYLAIQDTGLLRTMRLHQIERHEVQLTLEDALRLAAEAQAEPTSQPTPSPAGR